MPRAVSFSPCTRAFLGHLLPPPLFRCAAAPGRTGPDAFFRCAALHAWQLLPPHAQKSQALRKCGAPGFFISGESGWIDDQTAALFFFLPVIASMNTAIAPSPVTLQAVPKES